ncbi:uncharacterized protein TNCV_3586921 [Trichonephila clavipes]|nr:uncharacterized protein TNCV_3586921 [Trichonephila clavipes]
MYGRANDNDTAALRMCRMHFPDRRMPDHRIFQWLHRQLRETRSFHVSRHDADRRRAVSSPSLVESMLNVVADRPESTTTAVTHYRVQALNPEDYLLRLPVEGTAM